MGPHHTYALLFSLPFLCAPCLGFGDLNVVKEVSGKDVTDLVRASATHLSGSIPGQLKPIEESIEEAMKTGSIQLRYTRTSRRRLHGASCFWKNGECVLSRRSAEELLQGSSSHIGEYIWALFQCGGNKGREACYGQDWCFWYKARCRSNFYLLELNSISECLGRASIFLALPEREKECMTANGRRDDCIDLRDCAWDEDNSVCSFDIWKALVGVPSSEGSPLGLAKVAQIQANAWVRASIANVGLLTSSQPATILKWRPPKIKCPEDVSEVVCAYAGPLDELFVTTIYCNRQYPEAWKGCTDDPLCEASYSRCTVSSGLKTAVFEKQVQALRDFSSDDPIVEDILLPFISCPAKVLETACGEQCEWDEESNTCGPSSAWIIQKLREASTRSSAPQCKILAGIYAAGCVGIDSDACSANPKCRWSSNEGRCSMEKDELLSLITTIAPDTKEAVSAHRGCLTIADKAACG